MQKSIFDLYVKKMDLEEKLEILCEQSGLERIWVLTYQKILSSYSARIKVQEFKDLGKNKNNNLVHVN